jgi:hypothetical protein
VNTALSTARSRVVPGAVESVHLHEEEPDVVHHDEQACVGEEPGTAHAGQGGAHAELVPFAGSDEVEQVDA